MSGAERRIAVVEAWEALDSRGRPTVAARIELESGIAASAMAPSGASAGSHEAVELRDGGTRYGGRGVLRAVENVLSVLADSVRGLDVTESGAVDDALRRADPSTGFATMGANAVLAVSIAAERAAAAAEGVSLARRLAGPGALAIPMPMVNVLSGGAHAAGALDIQDLLVVPVAARSFAQAIEWAATIRDASARVAIDRGLPGAALAADEGGVGVPLARNRDALELLVAGIDAAGFRPGEQVGIAIDVAASEFWVDGQYRLLAEGRTLSSDGLVDEVAGWCREYPVISVEDILGEDDWDGWATATSRLGADIQLVGDDLFVTDRQRLERGIAGSVANALLAKVNQNGLLSESRRVVETARRAGYAVVVSARSGETEESWLADLAVGWGAEQIKVGSTHRSERGAKWNRLLELEARETTEFAAPWPR